MKSLHYHLTSTFPFNPENCVPYDGVEFFDVFKPIDTNREEFEKELQEEIDANKDEFGVCAFKFIEVIELNDEEFTLYNGEYLPNDEAAHLSAIDEHFKNNPPL